MSRFLTQEWLDETRRLLNVQLSGPGPSARLQYIVTGGTDGDLEYFWILEDGRLVQSEIGELVDADVTLTQTYEDAVRIQRGELDANAAYMQGRVKVSGNMAKLMSILPVTASGEYKGVLHQIDQDTEY